MASKPCKKILVKSSEFYFPPILSLDNPTPNIGNQKKQKTYPVIGIHQYQGLFKVIPTISTGFGEAFNVRLEPLDVLDWIWLDYSSSGTNQNQTTSSSTIAGSQPDSYVMLILHQNIYEAKVLDTFTLSVKNKELLPWKFHRKVDDSALFLIPIAMGGFVLIAENYVEYMNPLVPSMNCSTALRPTFFTTYCMIDENRYFLSDSDGVMYVLVLMVSPSPASVPSIYCTALGVTCLPSSISYIQDGYVLVGSKFGDSMLVQLLDDEEARFYPVEERLPPPPVFYRKRRKIEAQGGEKSRDEVKYEDLAASSIRLVQSFPGMGPISDFCVVERQGQGIIVACCGAYQDSTLRIIRNGIGMEVYGKGGVENCLGVRTLELKGRSLIVVCLIDETRILESLMPSSNFEQVFSEPNHNYGLETEYTTLDTFPIHNSQYIVQVCHEFVRVISTSNFRKVSEWNISRGDLDTRINESQILGEISQCSIVNDTSIVLGIGSHILFLSINLDSGNLTVSKSFDAGNQISSLTVSSKEYLVFSTWSFPPVVSFLRIRDFQVVKRVSIPSTSQTLIHGIFSQKFESATDEYIFVSMGDGDLFYFTISTAPKFNVTSCIKKANLGSQPATFHSFRNNNQTNVFACSDRPTILYHRASKLLFSSVNLKNVVGIASLPNFREAESGDQSLVVATEDGFLIGEMEAVQKLHVKSVKVGETCRRIVEWGEDWFGVVTVSHQVIDDEKKEVNYICLFDSTTFEVADRCELQEYEYATSLLVTELSGDSVRYLIVGTGLAYPDLDEPLEGRILVFALSKTQERQLEMVHESKVTGCVYSMVNLRGKLIAGINAKVMVFDWDAANKTLQLECTHYGYVIALYLATRGEMIIVGDLMKSVSCLFYDDATKTMSLHCRDFDTRWMTSVETLESSQIVIGSDNYKNLFTLQKDTESKGMIMGSRFHLGELVNRFRRGSLVMKAGDSPLIANPTLLFCTVSGSIGVISTVDNETFSILDRLQTQMRKLESVGMLSAEEFRAFETDRSRLPASGVIDGDLLENFSELGMEIKNEISNSVGMSTEEISNLTQEISRLH